MAEFTIPKNGTICWHELATKDLNAAKSFYQELFGWKLEQSKLSPVPYDEIHIDNEAVGGMMAIDESWGENPPPSHWSAYIAVEDTDATVEKIKQEGGSISVEPFEAPGVGRIARAADPAGAQFYIIQFATP